MNWKRVTRARRIARLLLAFAVLLAVYPLFLWIAGGLTDPSFGPTPPMWLMLLPYGIGTAGVLFGLAWMWRIYKAPTKDEGARWRFRDH